MRYTLLINTCDRFEDCWDPFFKLFSTYWPDYSGKIYLNTEYKEYSYPGLDITCTKVCEANKIPKNRRVTWSQCLLWALEQIDTNVILYLQEDYFLRDYVQSVTLDELFELMVVDSSIKCLHLTDQAVLADRPSNYKNLDFVNFFQRYRVSCQAAFWDKNEIIKLLRPYENAWEFEEFGSKRSSIIASKYLVVNKSLVVQKSQEILPYVFTGIIQGRWFPEVIPLFERHSINIDFSKRGLWHVGLKKSIVERLKGKLKRTPILIRNSFLTLKVSIAKIRYS